MTKFEHILNREGDNLLEDDLVQDLREVMEAYVVSKIRAKAEMNRMDNCCGNLDSVIDALEQLRDNESLLLDLMEEAASRVVLDGI